MGCTPFCTKYPHKISGKEFFKNIYLKLMLLSIPLGSLILPEFCPQVTDQRSEWGLKSSLNFIPKDCPGVRWGQPGSSVTFSHLFTHKRLLLEIDTKMFDVLAGSLVATWPTLFLSSENHMDLDGIQEVEEQKSILGVPPNSREDGWSTWMDWNKDNWYYKKTSIGNPGRAISAK